ncbi:MAG: hypothetical protein IKU10_01280 [Clostridia bacterium]|nr:hypothetical protein [Clostridia bacterium]
MKRLIAIVLATFCVLGLCSCNLDENTPIDETGTFFIGKVIEIKGSTMLVEVTNKGNCGVSEGAQVSVPTDKIAGVLDNDPAFVTDRYVRIEFDGTILETYPLQLGEVFKIDVTNADGESVE